jgi:hypothetical protein
LNWHEACGIKKTNRHLDTQTTLESIIGAFCEITGLPNICGTIDSKHILCADYPNQKATFTCSNFFNRKKFQSIVLQAICDAIKFFWDVCVG